MLARTPGRQRRRRPRAVTTKRLPRHRRIAIRDALAEMMRVAEPTAFALEAPCRYGLRVALIFEGWTWVQADAEAALLVLAALDMAGARRPTWQQGQPEWTQDGVILQTRERCVRCARPLPEGNYKFCGNVCAKAAAADRARRVDREERLAKEKVWRAAWIKRQPARVCELCGSSFQPKRASQKLCGQGCRRDHAGRLARRNMQMLCEAVHDDA